MYEKLLALLVGKFPQARKDGLQQMARTLAIHVADETEAQALVEKITSDKVTEYIKDWRKEVDSEVSNSTKTFENTLKGKYDFVEKKTPNPTPNPTDPNDIAAIVKNSVEAAVKPLQEEIQMLKSGKTVETRKQLLEQKLAEAPAVFKTKVLKDFARMNFETDEEFDAYVVETEADAATATQEIANGNLSGFPRPVVGSGGQIGEKQILADVQDWAKKTAPTENK